MHEAVERLECLNAMLYQARTGEVRLILDTRNLLKQLAPSLPAIVKPDKKTGRVLVVPDAIVKIRRQIVNERNEEKVRQAASPSPSGSR